MILLPYARLEGTTSLSAPELRARMLQFLERTPPSEVPPSLLPTWGIRYAGRVDESAFRLVALSKFKQPYLPVFSGEFVPAGSGVRLQGVVSASRFELVVLSVLILTLAAVSKSVLVAGVGLVFHGWAYLVAFLPHKNAFAAWLEGLPGWAWSRRTRG